MTIELKPVGVACHQACKYCYQEPLRKAGNTNPIVGDVDKMLDVAERTGQKFTIFGGEGLLTPKPELEKIFKKGYELFGSNGVQTNGDLIDDEHLEMFVKYKVGVGVSIDGPGRLNRLRVSRKDASDKETDRLTEKVMTNLRKMRRRDINLSVIATLHTQNGLPEHRQELKNWVGELADMRISGNFHLLESDTQEIAQRYQLSQEDEIELLLDLAQYFEDNPPPWKPFQDMVSLLTLNNADQAVCIWHMCDPLTTQAVHGIERDGSLSNCGRISSDGVPWLKADSAGGERYISLYNTPQEFGGCKDCRFFLMCGGECPGTGESFDWRNKTTHCASLMALYEHYEKRLIALGITPTSKRPERKKVEAFVLQKLQEGQRVPLQYAFSNYQRRSSDEGHGDSPHGDTPHGDDHQDHYDG